MEKKRREGAFLERQRGDSPYGQDSARGRSPSAYLVKRVFGIFLVFVIQFYIFYHPSAFCQSQEFKRIRATYEGVPIRQINIPMGKSGVEYYIAVGDKLEVFVWQNPELTRDVVVGPDGTISYPFIGRLKAEGFTVSQIEYIMRRELVHFFNQLNDVQSAGWAKGATLAKNKPAISEYVIKEEDIVEISVWQNPDLSREVIVGPDGKISYPLIGRIQLAGLTISQVEDTIREKLSEYVKFPNVSIMIKKHSQPLRVSVILKELAGSKIVVLGEVNYPGIYTYLGSINLIDAIALAGDFREGAQKNSIIVVRGNLSEEPEVKRINLVKAITKGVDNESEDIIVKPNDVVFVPTTFVANLNKFIADIGPVINEVSGILDIKNRN